MAFWKRHELAGPSDLPGFIGRVEDRPTWLNGSLTITISEGHDSLHVVGESRFQAELWQIVGGLVDRKIRQHATAILIAQQENPADPNAVGVWIDGFIVGYLSRSDAAAYRPGLLAYQQRVRTPIGMAATIIGGTDKGQRYPLGVVLSHDATDFGLASRLTQLPKPSTSAGTVTGRHAVEDHRGRPMTWFDTMPDDDHRAISYLRKQLATATDPLHRHFAYNELERRLYRCRDAFASALTEFDQACEAHQAEMATILPALIAATGGVPMLPTYKQACIRHQKAKNPTEAARWADLGIAAYGNQPLDPTNLEDLAKRLAKLRPSSPLDQVTDLPPPSSHPPPPPGALPPPPNLPPPPGSSF